MQYIDDKREEYIAILTDDLPVLRAHIHISQGELARGIGISRQIYSLIETGKQRMTRVTFMAMIAFFVGYAKAKHDLAEIGLID